METKRVISTDYLFSIVGKLYVENELMKLELSKLREDNENRIKDKEENLRLAKS